jgi:hypothetical protein
LLALRLLGKPADVLIEPRTPFHPHDCPRLQICGNLRHQFSKTNAAQSSRKEIIINASFGNEYDYRTKRGYIMPPVTNCGFPL